MWISSQPFVGNGGTLITAHDDGSTDFGQLPLSSVEQREPASLFRGWE